MKLGEVFDPRRNALNAFRLALAIEVIVFHSYLIPGRTVSSEAVLQLLLCVGVDGFFAISGFLIASSWLRDPRLRDYLVARALRILPGLYVCLLLIAFVFAPVSVAIQGGSPAKLLLSSAPFEYVLKNATLVSIFQRGVDGTPHGVPEPGIWDGALWSLIWEVMCYLAVAVLGIVGLASRRWISPAVFVLALVGSTLVAPLAFPGEWSIPQLIARSAITFSAGAIMYQWKDLIPARWCLVAVSVLIVLVSSLLPNYRVAAAIPLAYAIVVSGSLIHNRRLSLRTDLSYGMYIYSYPAQQMLAVCGLAGLNTLAFFVLGVITTLPLAALSWFLVEKPALLCKSHLKHKWATDDRDVAIRVAGQPVSKVPGSG
ncbi:acyltransferase family protein [Mycobacterium montefiorense]|uniref:Acyltransferase n=1 Tax=Mycobacterium montefiorense TaxID=154654 RepID=A0AA37UXL7_9MYCO|nr:acyltransferase [Mycobacterium montefiorense]GBG36918.1 acyltransferase [Mycobacterium montefiorense]GKU37824.1 acyltransferase [Mycobacterium montefiorense]GKU42783.1 acyltransferase [Mycobacterium montefiorense]GKU46340.1 acyltransferase [Mycobacterium montefiorense]GKU51076.1 acyltransferase [Mycobacterium montefiorense]